MAELPDVNLKGSAVLTRNDAEVNLKGIATLTQNNAERVILSESPCVILSEAKNLENQKLRK